MTTFVIVSDSHRNRAALNALRDVFSECDYIVHLGDFSSDGAYVKNMYSDKTIIINGNCDIDKLGVDEYVLQAEGVSILMCHGHRYGVKQTLEKLLSAAKENSCGVALYGHTHRACSETIDGIKLINPGSLSRYGEQSYCYMVVHKGKVTEKIVRVTPHT